MFGCRNTTAPQLNDGVVGLSQCGSRIINDKFVVHLWPFVLVVCYCGGVLTNGICIVSWETR